MKTFYQNILRPRKQNGVVHEMQGIDLGLALKMVMVLTATRESMAILSLPHGKSNNLSSSVTMLTSSILTKTLAKLPQLAEVWSPGRKNGALPTPTDDTLFHTPFRIPFLPRAGSKSMMSLPTSLSLWVASNSSTIRLSPTQTAFTSPGKHQTEAAAGLSSDNALAALMAWVVFKQVGKHSDFQIGASELVESITSFFTRSDISTNKIDRTGPNTSLVAMSVISPMMFGSTLVILLSHHPTSCTADSR